MTQVCKGNVDEFPGKGDQVRTQGWQTLGLIYLSLSPWFFHITLELSISLHVDLLQSKCFFPPLSSRLYWTWILLLSLPSADNTMWLFISYLIFLNLEFGIFRFYQIWGDASSWTRLIPSKYFKILSERERAREKSSYHCFCYSYHIWGWEKPESGALHSFQICQVNNRSPTTWVFTCQPRCILTKTQQKTQPQPELEHC